jgi:hypothetical protein
MSRHERRYQKYLDRKRQKHGYATTGSGRLTATPAQIATATHSPIHEALVPAKLFEIGMGNLFFSRSLPDGRIALAGFLLDTFCLGVKDAFVGIATKEEYFQCTRRRFTEENLQPMQPACFRKLVEGGVAYAQDLGFPPHADYALASQIFDDVQASDCSTHFEYGREGKPFYVPGPHDSPARIQTILDQLERRVGEGNYDYLVLAG